MSNRPKTVTLIAPDATGKNYYPSYAGGISYASLNTNSPYPWIESNDIKPLANGLYLSNSFNESTDSAGTSVASYSTNYSDVSGGNT